jgi:hypothetical protein
MFGFIVIVRNTCSHQITVELMRQLTGQKWLLQEWEPKDLSAAILDKNNLPDANVIMCIEIEKGDRIKFLTQATYQATFVASFRNDYLSILKNRSGAQDITMDLANRNFATVRDLLKD